MRIQDEDTNELMHDGEYIPPQERYIPGKRVELIRYERAEEQSSQLGAIVEDDVDVESEDLPAQPSVFSHLSLDLNLAKFVAIACLFVVMFVLPAALSEGALRLPDFGRTNVYTQSVVSQTTPDQNGRVAGASDVQTGDEASRSDLLRRIGEREIFGVSLSVIFIVIGILLVVLPLLILVA